MAKIGLGKATAIFDKFKCTRNLIEFCRAPANADPAAHRRVIIAKLSELSPPTGRKLGPKAAEVIFDHYGAL